MSWTSALAIYFIVWWVTLFAVLPFGVRNAHESGTAVADGHDAGAPVTHGLAWKAKMTTIVATFVFVLVYWALTSGGLEWLAGLAGGPPL
jgi:predicted secreted protein